MGELFTFFGLISHDHAFIYMTHMLLAAGIVILLARLATGNMKVVPTGTQNFLEAYLSGVLYMGTDVMGKEEARRYLPLVATIGLFVATANIIGVIPGFEAPTAFLDFTLALALVVFVYYNFEGIRRNGVITYFKHFLGPVWWLYWLMFPIEIVSHISRVISLSFRLFGNILGGSIIILVVSSLVSFVVFPIGLNLFFGVFIGTIQAFVFTMLALTYIGVEIAE